MVTPHEPLSSAGRGPAEAAWRIGRHQLEDTSDRPTQERTRTMLEDAQLVGFVGVSDLDAAERFYGGVLGLALRDARPFALVHETPAAQLRITLVEQVGAAPYTVLGWSVADLEGEVDRLAGLGISFNRYDGMDQDDRGIWTSPSGARVAWFHDPDCNNLSLTAEPSAKRRAGGHRHPPE